MRSPQARTHASHALRLARAHTRRHTTGSLHPHASLTHHAARVNNGSHRRIICSLALTACLLIAAGESHSMCLTVERGQCYTWGVGDYGKLGHGDEEDQRTPKRVEALLDERVCGVAAAEQHSLAVTSSGALYAWGHGASGELGHCDFVNQLRPKRVEALQRVESAVFVVAELTQ